MDREFVLGHCRYGDARLADFYRWLYEAQKDLEFVRHLLMSFRDGFESEMNGAVYALFKEVMTEEREALFQAMLADPSKLFKLPIDAHTRPDIEKDLDYLRRRNKKAGSKRRGRVLDVMEANRILTNIRERYRHHRWDYPSREDGIHFSRQIMDRLTTVTRRGYWSSNELVEWVNIVRWCVRMSQKDKFTKALLSAHWSNVERLYCDWMETAQECVHQIVYDDTEEGIFY